VLIDSQNNIITSGALLGDDFPITDGGPSFGLLDLISAKFDKNGQPIWMHRVGVFFFFV